MNHTLWQRIKRRISLSGGSYTHPDGTIELDFEASAGIDPFRDSEAVQELKLRRYYEKQRKNERRAGALMLGAAAFLAVWQLGLPLLSAIPIGAFTTWVALLLVGNR